MPGTGKLILTGKLGDVMKESAQAALSLARARADQYGIAPDFHEKRDIHIHVPAGATPKDGPSAGVTLVTALISALSETPICADLAMTGEISLRGRVLPVGGIKEKILAAVSHGMRRVLIPSQNKKDLEEVPADLLKRIEVKTVERIEEIWPLACKKAPAKGGKAKAAPAEKAAPKAAAGKAPKAPAKNAKEVNTKTAKNITSLPVKTRPREPTKK